ncbi:unnamed protein product [Polarella glacialis]|uniref:Uncharacterized protein n=1 Tax=Polarella glacialis TaxID=89957 RepID=A0A813DNV5_POLGL|nr:unnamed protein product [Polarella glacialis]
MDAMTLQDAFPPGPVGSQRGQALLHKCLRQELPDIASEARKMTPAAASTAGSSAHVAGQGIPQWLAQRAEAIALQEAEMTQRSGGKHDDLFIGCDACEQWFLADSATFSFWQDKPFFCESLGEACQEIRAKELRRQAAEAKTELVALASEQKDMALESPEPQRQRRKR